jgi:hypothetical protein
MGIREGLLLRQYIDERGNKAEEMKQRASGPRCSAAALVSASGTLGYGLASVGISLPWSMDLPQGTCTTTLKALSPCQTSLNISIGP